MYPGSNMSTALRWACMPMHMDTRRAWSTGTYAVVNGTSKGTTTVPQRYFNGTSTVLQRYYRGTTVTGTGTFVHFFLTHTVLVVFLIKRLGRVSSTRIIMFLLPLIIEPFSNRSLTVLLPYFDRSFTVFLPSGNHRTHRRTETVRSVL